MKKFKMIQLIFVLKLLQVVVAIDKSTVVIRRSNNIRRVSRILNNNIDGQHQLKQRKMEQDRQNYALQEKENEKNPLTTPSKSTVDNMNEIQKNEISEEKNEVENKQKYGILVGQTRIGVKPKNKDDQKNSNDESVMKESRIYGGKTVHNKNDYPFIGFPTGTKNCVATLFHDDLMLSAASCGNAFDTGVFLGGFKIDGSTSRRLQVSRTIVHPKYNDTTNENNIMIIKLAQLVTDVEKVILNLNEPSYPPTGTGVEVLGYGATSEQDDYSETLQMARFMTGPADRCGKYPYYDDSDMICTWFPGGGRDSCDGDAGGPILIKNEKYQIGIVSYGRQCGEGDHPSVNTRISSYTDFINHAICKLSSINPNPLSPTCIKF